MQTSRNLPSILIAVAFSGLMTSHVDAQNITQTWLGNNSTSLTDAANWSPASAPVNLNALIFGVAGSAGTSITVTGGGLNLGYTGSGVPALDFGVGASAYTFSGSTQLTAATGGLRNQSGQTQTFNNPFRFNTGSTHTLSNANSALIFNNTTTVNANSTFSIGSASGQSITIGGNLTLGGVGPWNVTMNGGANTSTVSLNGSNNTGLSGNLSIGQNVRVNVGSSTGLGSATNVVMNGSNAQIVNTSGTTLSTGASLAINTTSALIFGQPGDTASNSMAFNGSGAINADLTRTITLNGSGLSVTSGSVWNNTATGNRTLTVNGAGNTLGVAGFAIGASGETNNVRFDINGAGSVTVSGGLTNGLGTGTRSLQYNGAGTLLISGASSYNGTTGIGGSGTLLVNGTHTGGQNYSVAGILGGTGTIDLSANNSTVNFVSSGDGRLQAASADGLTIIGGAASAITLNNSIDTETGRLLFTLNSPGTTAVEVQGLLTIGTGFLDFGDFSFTAGTGFGVGTYRLFDYTTLSGTLGSSLTGTVGGLDATISLDVPNTAVVLTVVPEPSTILLTALTGLGALAVVRRRRRN